MVSPQITIPQWLALDSQIREKLIELFNIPRSEGTTVVDNRVVSDGHTHADLAVVTLESINKHLGKKKEQEFFTALNRLIEKIVADFEVEAAQQLEASKQVRLKEIEDNNRAILDNVAKLLGSVTHVSKVSGDK